MRSTFKLLTGSCSRSTAGFNPFLLLPFVKQTPGTYERCWRSIASLILFSVCSASANATGNLAGYWTFNEGTGTTAADSSGNGNSGVLTNSPTWVVGKIGEAVSLGGNTSYVAVNGAGNLADLYATGMTVTAWINPSSTGGAGRGRIIDKDDNGNGWFFCLYTSTSLEFAVPSFDTTALTRLSGNSITLNTWQHVAVTWDGTSAAGNVHFYVNGVSSDSSTETNGGGSPNDDSAVPFTVGNRHLDLARGFAGAIDDLRVYNTVLTAAQIQAIANDSQPPTAPTSPSTAVVSSSAINLSWTASTDNVGVTGYWIERCQGAGCSSFAQIGTTSGATTYADSGLAASTSYSYRLRATDGAGLLSNYSTVTTATTSSGGGDTTPPTAPSGLAVSGTPTTSQINLTWTASTDNVGVTGYLVERCQGSGCSSFAQIGTSTGPSYADTGLSPATSYSYRTRAQDAAGNLSSYSNIISGTTQSAGDTQPPSSPSNLTASINGTTITLAWTASTDNVGVTNYLVERCQGTGCTNFAQIGTSTTTSYVDSGLAGESTYDYRVRATDAAGNLSGYSNALGSTTQDCD